MAAFQPAIQQDYETSLAQRAPVQVVQAAPFYWRFGYPYYYSPFWYGLGFRYYGGAYYRGGARYGRWR